MRHLRRTLLFTCLVSALVGSVGATIQTLTSSAVLACADQVTGDVCLNNTRDEAQCKDCCDSLDADGEARKACRDACPGHDFAQNSSFITLDVQSVLGPNGDYSLCTASGIEQTCKACCDSSSDLASGDRRFCRDACARLSTGGDAIPAQSGQGNPANPPRQPGSDNPPPPPDQGNPPRRPSSDDTQQGSAAPGPGNMNIEQALSTEAQRNTIAFSALAFLTGDFNADTFFPPGNVADMWGFQYLRDNDSSQMGHNTDFLTYAALNMLNILTADQRAELQALAVSQVEPIKQYAVMRFTLIDAFRRNLNGDFPAAASTLDLDAVEEYSAQLYRLDGEITVERAQVMSRILNSLTPDQRSALDAMAGAGMTSWGQPDEPADLRSLERDVKVNVMTYAGDLFSWYAGSVEADTYINPERQGTYFGAFYLKDAPAVGNPGYIISSTLTGDMGQAFLAVLTDEQRALIDEIVAGEHPYLLDIVATRAAISQTLRNSLEGQTIDTQAVLALMETYGEQDGAIVYLMAQNFARIGATLTDDQRAQLMALRYQMLGNLTAERPYLYSQVADMPAFEASDFLFR